MNHDDRKTTKKTDCSFVVFRSSWSIRLLAGELGHETRGAIDLVEGVHDGAGIHGDAAVHGLVVEVVAGQALDVAVEDEAHELALLVDDG